MRFLIKHVGNMGDLVFMIPPVLETLKKKHPGCHITLVTAWGYKKKSSWTKLEFTRNSWGLPRIARRATWGERNQSGFCIALMMTNPHVDQLVHFHTSEVSLDGKICIEEGQSFPTWNTAYYEQQKKSGQYDGVFELDFGLTTDDNPIQKVYEACGLPDETYSDYKIYLTDEDTRIANEVMKSLPHPRIVLLEGIEGVTTRGWDPAKVDQLAASIEKQYGVAPLRFGAKYIPTYNGKKLTLRQNIATLTLCDVAIGVLSGPMHFAAAVGLPTICLYGDQPVHRAAPAYFLNEYITDHKKYHRTVMGPAKYSDLRLLKDTSPNLTPAEQKKQGFRDWQSPGLQPGKSCLAVITAEEVLTVLRDALPLA